MTLETALQSPKQDGIVRAAGLICAVGLGSFFLWAGFAPLEEGVVAHGEIVIEDDSKPVQHLEGGIIKKVHVREGDRVVEGDVLLTLSEALTLAGRDQAIQEYGARAAAAARLRALLNDGAEPDFSDLETLDLGDAERRDIITREGDLFRRQRDGRAADIALLTARLDAARETQTLRDGEIAIVKRSLEAAEKEAALRVDMVNRQLARVDQATAAERQAAALAADIARLISEREAAVAEERDLQAQIAQAEAAWRSEDAEKLALARADLQSVEERLSAAQDQLDRSLILAPASGLVLNLAFAGPGGVVRPGETVLEIVPEEGAVSASVRIRPNDRAKIVEGQTVRTQIASYQGWSAPRLDGEVLRVSADLKSDRATGVSYYEARVLLPDASILEGGVDVRPGMPVEAFIHSGRSRTMLDYVFEPVRASLYRGLRQN